MPEQRYEYQVEPMFLAPDELRNARFQFDDKLNEFASEGWKLDSTLRIDGSSFLFVFSRPVES